MKVHLFLLCLLLPRLFGSAFNHGRVDATIPENVDFSVFWSASCKSISLTIFTSSGFLFIISFEMSYTSDLFIHPITDNITMSISIVEDCLDKAIVLEPIPLATFPPGLR